MWDWERAFVDGGVFQSVDDPFHSISLEGPIYEETFGVVPEFRIGIHGGDIVGSEEGNNRRDIDFYGDTISIAARMEQKAKDVGFDCVVTAEVYELSEMGPQFTALGTEPVRGIERLLGIFGYTPVTAP